MIAHQSLPELVRLTLPRRVYTEEHLTYVASVIEEVYSRRDEIPGLRMTYAPEHPTLLPSPLRAARARPLGATA